MGRAADAIREADAHWATVSLLSHLNQESARKRRRAVRQKTTSSPLAPPPRDGEATS